MATGMAKGARARGKRVAFGDGERIIWDQHSSLVFRHNANVARPGHEGSSDIEWIGFYKGHRIYNKRVGDRWVWNYRYKAVPGEMFFSPMEEGFASRQGSGFVLIEPNVPPDKSVAPNKRWRFERYAEVARRLCDRGYDVRQFDYPGAKMLAGVKALRTPSFRHALAVLKRASLYVGPEGGLHHGAAAVGIPAVVLFGGFIPPQVTGYDTHINLTGGAEACGSLSRCPHCAAAMAAISVDEVEDACRRILNCPTSLAAM